MVALADSLYAMDFSLPVWVSSYVEYAGHLEYMSPLTPQIHGMLSIVHLLTMFWMYAAGLRFTLAWTFLLVSSSWILLLLVPYCCNSLCNAPGLQVTIMLFKLMVKMHSSSLLGLLKTLDLKIFVLQEWCLQLLLHALDHVSYRHG